MKDGPAIGTRAEPHNAAASRLRPAVSVIVSVFNKSGWLPACLDSILSQTLRNIEVVCVDDASTDGSRDVLARYAALDPRIQVVCAPVNRGPGPTRNLGIACASAPFVQFTDADDLLPEHAIELLHRRAEKDCVPVVRGTMAAFHGADPQRQELLHEVRDRSNFAPFDERELWIPWWHPCYLFSRAFLVAGGISYPRLRSGEDPVFLASALAAAPRMSTIADVTYRYRIAELATKDRASFAGIQAFIHHARIVKGIFRAVHPASWTQGYGPLLQQDLERQIASFNLSDYERERLRAEVSQLFSATDAALQRILFVYRVCGLGGVETSILNKAVTLRKLGATVEVLFLDFWGNGGKSIAERVGVHVLRQREAQIDLLRKGWDAIVVVDSPEFVDTVLASGIECALIFETHVSYPPALKRCYSRVDDAIIESVITPSDFNKRLLLDAGCPSDRICVVPNALDSEAFVSNSAAPAASLAALPDDRPIVLSIGRVEPQKNTQAFVQVALKLLATGHALHFVIVGDAVDTQEYAARVRAAIPERSRTFFTFIQELRYESMPELYGRAARSGGCLLITSTNESQPMTLLEAMASECPVVAPDIGGIGEVVLDSVTGLLYPAGQIDAAVAAVRKVLTSPVMRERIVRQARDLLTLDHSPLRTAEFYMSITKKTRSAPRLVPNVAALATEPPQPMPSVVDSVPAKSVPPAKRSDAQDVAARLDALVGDFVSLHMALLRERDGKDERALATLFSRPMLDPSETAVKAYSDIAPGVQIGFEPSGSATLAVEPRRDFSHSPAHCLNTFTLRYSGKSRWFTLELALDWEELRNVDRYQIGLYVRADREAPGHVVLRLPRIAGGAVDHRLADFRLAPEERSCHCSGPLAWRGLSDPDAKRRPKLIFFFDPASNLALKFDYLTAYFA